MRLPPTVLFGRDEKVFNSRIARFEARFCVAFAPGEVPSPSVGHLLSFGTSEVA